MAGIITTETRRHGDLLLRGYALLESIIAMVVVMTCFGIAMLVYGQVLSSTKGKLGVEARVRLQEEAQQLKLADQFIDGKTQLNEFAIEKKIIPGNSRGLYHLQLKAIDPNGKELARYDELVFKP